MISKKTRTWNALRMVTVLCLPVLATVCISSCESDDPDPVNEEEVITTVKLTLVPDNGGIPVLLNFYDEDGEQGNTPPVITVSGPLSAQTTYGCVIELLNETVDPAADISEEVAEEADDHLFCFDVTGDMSVAYEDEDTNGMPLGLVTTWATGASGDVSVSITLKHQAGTKTGDCSTAGETDVAVTFDLIVN